MAKFKIRLSLEKFELEVDGEREDIPAITSAVQQQFGSLITSLDAVADGHKQLEAPAQGEPEAGKTRVRATRKRASSLGGDGVGQPIEFRHDPSKYGSPLQSWSVAEKSIWMLAVIERVAGQAEVSGPQLAATFNSQFKAAGRVHPPIVTRELARLKVQNPAWVGEDKGMWFLTEEGKSQAQRLVDGIISLQAS